MTAKKNWVGGFVFSDPPPSTDPLQKRRQTALKKAWWAVFDAQEAWRITQKADKAARDQCFIAQKAWVVARDKWNAAYPDEPR